MNTALYLLPTSATILSSCIFILIAIVDVCFNGIALQMKQQVYCKASMD